VGTLDADVGKLFSTAVVVILAALMLAAPLIPIAPLAIDPQPGNAAIANINTPSNSTAISVRFMIPSVR
jgi:hypothetical protein